jgi:glycosyltransferase involved in cell wall biosynthesis
MLLPLWDFLPFPRMDRLIDGADVVHGTNYYIPPTARARRVVTIHDLAFLVFPHLANADIVGPFAQRLHRYVAEADAIMAYSEATKADVVNRLGADPSKITVAPMAVDEAFRPVSRDEAQCRVREEYGIDGPFLLFVSTLEPRKNVPGLLRSFARLAPQIPHRLVLIGSVGWDADEIFQTISALHLEERVVRPGFVPHLRLPIFYGAADAFVFPTFYEGFGLPLLEALVCGCPVVASDNSSVPEVVGDAGLLVQADDEEGFAKAVMRILEEPSLRDDLASKGMRHAARFSWQGCAESTLEVYRRVVTV